MNLAVLATDLKPPELSLSFARWEFCEQLPTSCTPWLPDGTPWLLS